MRKPQRKEDDTIFKNSHGNEFLITGYNSESSRYNVISLGMYSELTCNITSIKKGTLKHPLDRRVHGIGYHGVGEYKTTDGKGKAIKAYVIWAGMIDRCYNKNNPTYKNYGGIGVTVCDNWHNYQNFADWFYKQNNCDNPAYDIDKDLVGANKYSEMNCLLVHNKINRFISMYFLQRPSVCVYYQGDNKKRASPWRININGKHRASFSSKEEAEKACIILRKTIALEFIENNKDLMAFEVYTKLLEKVKNYGA